MLVSAPSLPQFVVIALAIRARLVARLAPHFHSRRSCFLPPNPHAVIYALGGKLPTVNADFNENPVIRKGCSEATVEVDLFNGSPHDSGTFEHAKYGQIITVRRVISWKENMKGGAFGSKFMFVNATTGVSHAAKVSDVQHLCETFNIIIDNPVLYLSQEEAKSFIKGKPTEQYRVCARLGGGGPTLRLASVGSAPARSCSCSRQYRSHPCSFC